MEKIIEKICIKIFSKDFRKISVINGILGLVLLWGTAGASDKGANFEEMIPYIILGLALMVVSFGYIFLYEYIWTD